QRATGTYNSLGVGRPSADRVHLLSGSVTEQGVRSDRVIATAPTGLERTETVRCRSRPAPRERRNGAMPIPDKTPPGPAVSREMDPSGTRPKCRTCWIQPVMHSIISEKIVPSEGQTHINESGTQRGEGSPCGQNDAPPGARRLGCRERLTPEPSPLFL